MIPLDGIVTFRYNPFVRKENEFSRPGAVARNLPHSRYYPMAPGGLVL